MKFLIIILIIIIISMLMFIIMTKQKIKFISKEIEKNQGKYLNIHTNSLNDEIEDLVKKINLLFDEKQKINWAKNYMEEEIRQSIANMSHDLRTPLTSIRGYIQLIKSKDINEIEREEYIEIIERKTDNLERLISSFYDLSRLEGNEYKFYLKSISLEKLLYDTIALYYNDFVVKNIEPIIEIEENLGNIISDESAVCRVFSNLIGNALKHGSEFIKISLRNEENFIISEFTNGAPKLNEELAGKLFDRFFTGDKSRNDKNTGLGLAITKKLVEKLNNEIVSEFIDGQLKITIKWQITSKQ